MIIENSFEVPVAPERALDVLTDVPAIAPCIPGVTLTETSGGNAYRGIATVRLGPVSLSFSGEARITRIDRAARTARVEAEGADRKGRGRARASVEFNLTPAGGGTRVDVRSDVTLSGQVAQYGRASGLINEVANQIISDFARNLERKIAAETPPAPETGTASASSRTGAGGATRANEIPGLAIFWRALRAMIARLFSRGGTA